MTTRNITRHAIFGNACELPYNVLPTNEQVAQHFLHIKTRKNDTNKDKYKAVSEAVISLWNKASIPTIHPRSVMKRVETLISTGSELCRSKSSSTRQATFLSSMNSLFDIAACNCLISNDESTKQISTSCKCPKHLKVPQQEQLFLLDQRNSRKMFIGSLDVESTKRLRKRMLRKQDDEDKAKKVKKTSDGDNKLDFDEDEANDSDTAVEASYQESDCEVLVFPDSDAESCCSENTRPCQMRLPLPHLAKEADRYGISDRAAASLATAVLIDVGFVSKEDQSFVIDKNKVHRERQKLRENLQRGVKQSHKFITGIYFDGRRDVTLVKVNRNSKWYGDTIVEDHYVLVEEPGGNYLTHVTPLSGKSTDIASSILKVIRDADAGDCISAVGCDSTNTNTGCKAGVIRQIELGLQHPVNWFICMLHTNELPLRHLFKTLDGSTSGPLSFSGPIGSELKHCEEKSIVNFENIACYHDMPELSEDVLDDLSCDQKYLYEIIKAITTGIVPQDLSERKPGPLNHARWLTLANRVCRLYVSSENPSSNLRIVTHFIVTNYGPNWFDIKRNSLCTDGARHIYEASQRLKLLSNDIAAIVKPYFSRSAYFAQAENILIAMLADSDEIIRSRAVDVILRLRQKASSCEVRQFRVPSIDYEATNYVDLIDWKDVHEPPVTKGLSDEDIAKLRIVPLTLDYKNHTQGVERCIKLVTDASTAVYGFEARDGFIRARVNSRNLMPLFESKKDYCENFL